jgi:two-component system nitrogen regulation sensor histidine kinase GlnL
METRHLQPSSIPPLSWQDILASLEEAVIVVDAEGKISFFNQAAEALTGLAAFQFQGRSYVELFRSDRWLLDIARVSLPPQQTAAQGEGELSTRRGPPAPVSLSVSPLVDPAGRSTGAILLLRDLTLRKEIEEDLRRSDRLAMLGTLAAGLAHEVKNPLGGIKGAAQLLKRDLPQVPEAHPYADVIVREADRLNLLIEQLLDLCRPVRLRLAPVNVHELLDDVLLLEQAAPHGATVAIKKRYDPSLPPVAGDRDQLTQVFLNLTRNALEALDGRGHLTVTTRMETDFHVREQGRERGSFIWVDIEDDGPGILADLLPHIFSPFFTTKNNGTGLGLATCYRIVREHGGLIRVDNRIGAGATFKVSLRVAE